MTRYRMTVEYDGAAFVGWQRQDNGFAVQQALEAALNAMSGETVTVFGAGRTDSGVHALGQVAHFDLAYDFGHKDAPGTIRDALNFHVRPHPVSVLEVSVADDEFHSRFDATGRRYLYRIANRRAPLAVDRGRCWRVGVPLDVAAMHDAAQVLVGKHDFTTFRATLCQAKSPVKTLDRLDVVRVDDEIHIHVEAQSFLHHQVRNIVGTLKWVGDGKWSRDDVVSALEARHRTAGGETAPAEGLYLVGVSY
ncbi:MAG: tRNA pseudouridine(38-40) synthase TruA [Rhodospirillaceae bacterium]|nr:tRNA pseudouridine(38-40) synthase TruA [Rhodospirillaceae bacterium]MBT4220025.1 tRNA pseudouridine(38-40) synthase TruA [Rhodospirillaceae bacterium]MBT5013590.1 tRNA pseudouridine(38-40) synthase TruA [Rhodospirillaceae bacterium]MBT5308910.1 tRNA pseudouridine(38-40) synthase TruA [Rhodospirillaceae bacterium]MBT6406409.1 tRNA pseudouridine(38-40) synthase TruA [Rhodospirillaceae bacterium]